MQEKKAVVWDEAVVVGVMAVPLERAVKRAVKRAEKSVQTGKKCEAEVG